MAGGRMPAPTADGHVAMLPYTNDHWVAFFTGVGRPDLAERCRTETRHERNGRVKQLYADIFEQTRQLTTPACVAPCDRLDIPCTRIHSIGSLPQHPHLQAVGLFQPQQHPVVGPMVAMRPPTRFGRTPASIDRHAPVLGEHSAELLREAGYGDAEVAALLADRTITTTTTTPTTETPR